MLRLHVLVFIALAIPGSLSAQSGQEQAGVSVRQFLQGFDSNLKDRFLAAFSDLNGDGNQKPLST
jgi:hypothetical protein